MNEATRTSLGEHLDILCCPRCRGDLSLADEALACSGCGERFAVEGNIPLLYWPNEWSGEREDVTTSMRAFYEETPFPNYDEFDGVASLVEKARRGMFAKSLDDQIPSGARVLECGCGTGQLSNFLSIANRTVFGTDLCHNSLRLGQAFKEQNGLKRANFLQMNLFRPAFKPGSFDLVISSGVLHHTSDPYLGFETISQLARPGGFVMVGLYHRYGRLVTDLRRWIFRASRNRFTWLDPNLRRGGFGSAKWRAWFMDQYKNPHESKHTIGEVMGWLERAGLSFVTSVPRTRPFARFSERDSLFRAEPPGTGLERRIAELALLGSGSREGGFFLVIGKKPPAGAAGTRPS